MSYRAFTCVLIFAMVGLARIASCAKPWCVEGINHKVDCNTCWCFNGGVPVCTKIPCDQVKNESENNTSKVFETHKRFAVGISIGINIFISIAQFCGMYG